MEESSPAPICVQCGVQFAPGSVPDRCPICEDARQFVSFTDGSGVGPRALAANVQDIGTVSGKLQAVVDGTIYLNKTATVGKTVRSHVDDAHHEWSSRHTQLACTQLP